MRFHTFLLKYGEIGIKGKNRFLFGRRTYKTDALTLSEM